MYCKYCIIFPNTEYKWEKRETKILWISKNPWISDHNEKENFEIIDHLSTNPAAKRTRNLRGSFAVSVISFILFSVTPMSSHSTNITHSAYCSQLRHSLWADLVFYS